MKYLYGIVLGLAVVALTGCQTGPLAQLSQSILGPAAFNSSLAERENSAYEQELPSRRELSDNPQSRFPNQTYQSASRLGFRRGSLPCQT